MKKKDNNLHPTVIVAGCHRSGTSALAQILSSAGVFMGEQLMGASEFNVHGHVEDLEVVAINDRILSDNGRDWQLTEEFIPVLNYDIALEMRRLVDRRRRLGRLWGFKDPRTSVLLPLWKQLIPTAKFVAVFRSPADCVASLEKRHFADLLKHPAERSHWRFWTEPDFAVRIWLTYNRAILRFVRANPDRSILVPFESLTSPPDLVDRIEKRCSIGLSRDTIGSAWDPAARHQHKNSLVVHDPGTRADVEQLYRQLTLESSYSAHREDDDSQMMADGCSPVANDSPAQPHPVN